MMVIRNELTISLICNSRSSVRRFHFSWISKPLDVIRIAVVLRIRQYRVITKGLDGYGGGGERLLHQHRERLHHLFK